VAVEVLLESLHVLLQVLLVVLAVEDQEEIMVLVLVQVEQVTHPPLVPLKVTQVAMAVLGVMVQQAAVVQEQSEAMVAVDLEHLLFQEQAAMVYQVL
jgi:hypothetical protein